MTVGFIDRTHLLAVGFEPIDPTTGLRNKHPLRIDVEGAEPWSARQPGEPYRTGPAQQSWRRREASKRGRYPSVRVPWVDRHDSGVQALLVQPGVDAARPLRIRIYDHSRYFVPRRFELSVAALPQTRSPALFPGASYDLGSRLTGMRGRVLRGTEPMRWARVEARLPGLGTLVGRAQGDDRGEFVLLLAPAAAPFVDLVDPLPIEVTVFGPQVVPAPTNPEDLADPYWDLPLETPDPPSDPAAVESGETLPSGYVASLAAPETISFRLGRTISARDGVPDFVFQT